MAMPAGRGRAATRTYGREVIVGVSSGRRWAGARDAEGGGSSQDDRGEPRASVRAALIDRPAVRRDVTVARNDVTGGPDIARRLGWDLEDPPVRHTLRPWRRSPAVGVMYAELPLRAIAFALDLLLIQVVVTGLASPLLDLARAAFLERVGSGQDLSLRYVVTAVGPTFVLYTVVTAAVAVYFWSTFRASPGQMAFGLFTVTRTDGLPLRPTQALVRWLMIYAPAVFLAGFGPITSTVAQLATAVPGNSDPGPALVLYAVLLLWPFAWWTALASSAARDRRGRGWHDKLAGSVVVRRDGSPS